MKYKLTMTILYANESHRQYVTSIILKRWGVSQEEADSEFSRWLVNDADSVCYVGLIKNKPMATGVFDTVKDEEVLNISPYNTLLWVEPDYRGVGYGKQLSEKRYRWAKDLGYQIIYLDTVDAEGYHLKNGWEHVKYIHHNGEKFTIMQRILNKTLYFKRTKILSDFAPILKPMADTFSTVFYDSILKWCNVIPYNKKDDKLWEMWLVTLGCKPIGVCGLYTLQGATDTKELWLGWLGILPELRNHGLGKQIMAHLYTQALIFGCERIYSYVDKDGEPLSFYKREGFEVIGTVASYCKDAGIPAIDDKDFEDGEDYVILKHLPKGNLVELSAC